MTKELLLELESMVLREEYEANYVPVFEKLRYEAMTVLSYEEDEKRAAGLRGEIKAYTLLISLPQSIRTRMSNTAKRAEEQKRTEETRNATRRFTEPAYIDR